MQPLFESDIRGVDPARILLGDGPTLIDKILSGLAHKGASVSRLDIAEALDEGQVTVDGSVAYIDRPIPDETQIPLRVLYADDEILAIDKPAGISTTPQGSFVARSVLVQARRQFDPRLVPAHRLDRATWGVVVLVRDPQYRGYVQAQFERRQVTKTYVFLSHAQVAPQRVRNRLVFDGTRMVETSGEVNADTMLTPVAREGDMFLYRAEPVTGQRHQIRAHAAQHGARIIGDTLYDGGQPPDRIALLSHSLQIRTSRGEEISLRSTIDLVKEAQSW